MYGKELILDLHGCDKDMFTQRDLTRFFDELIALIDMEKHGDPKFWHDDSDIKHLKGVSAVQFIKTSNIVVHALEALDAVYINIFSCKPFDEKVATEFTQKFFSAKNITNRIIERI